MTKTSIVRTTLPPQGIIPWGGSAKDLILSYSPNLKAPAVVALAKQRGVETTEGYVHFVRSRERTKGRRKEKTYRVAAPSEVDVQQLIRNMAENFAQKVACLLQDRIDEVIG